MLTILEVTYTTLDMKYLVLLLNLRAKGHSVCRAKHFLEASNRKTRHSRCNLQLREFPYEQKGKALSYWQWWSTGTVLQTANLHPIISIHILTEQDPEQLDVVGMRGWTGTPPEVSSFPVFRLILHFAAHCGYLLTVLAVWQVQVA